MGRKPCCDKQGLKKGPWTSDEDQKLIDFIHIHGPGNWRTLPNKAGLQRCGKSCRLRWANYLRPDIKRGKFSFEEEQTIIQLHSVLGNRWSAIAARLPGRTDNEIKNYYNTHIRRRLLRMGIDPVTHGPRLDHLNISSLLSTLQNPSLLNFPVLLNLQNLLNPELLKLATSLASSQNGLPNYTTQNPFLSNMLLNNPDDYIKSIIHNMPSSNNGLICSSTDHHNSVFSSNNHSNQSFSNNNNGSSFATALSSLSSSPNLYPLDSAYTYLDSSLSNEDEIDSYFMLNNEEEKLKSPVLQ